MLRVVIDLLQHCGEFSWPQGSSSFYIWMTACTAHPATAAAAAHPASALAVGPPHLDSIEGPYRQIDIRRMGQL
jgi:hypothetical protein